MRCLWLSLFSILVGCQSREVRAPQAAGVESKGNVISVGMPFARVEAKLQAYGALPSGFDVLLSPAEYRRGILDHYYELKNGDVLLILSKTGTGGRFVLALKLTSYRSKAWENKQDPDRVRFFHSFEAVSEIDLETTVTKR